MSSCRRLGQFVGAGAVLLSLAVPAQAAELFFSGSGWGLGIGLSQYGAKAMGADGNSYDEIITRYFTGVNIVPVATASPGTFVSSDPTPLWVGLIQDSNTVSFNIEVDQVELCFDKSGGCVLTAQPGQTYRFGPDGTGNCIFLRVPPVGVPSPVGSSGSCEASVRPLNSLSTISIPFKARRYRNGILRFRPSGSAGNIHTIYEIGIEDYMKGLSEVPESWPTAAIEAQVVTSRSWAVRTALDRGHEGNFTLARKRDCYCNLRDSSADQVFRGWTGEVAHPRWVEAVVATAQEVITYGGTVGLGLYSSSSGGWTESYIDVFGQSGFPYLVTVNDSPAFSDSAMNPHMTWAAGYATDILADVFGFEWVSNATVVERNASGSVHSVLLEGIVDGRPVDQTVSGTEIRTALSLRSTTFEIAVASVFSDVAPAHRFSGEVMGLKALGITDGCGSEQYCPDDEVSRAEMAAFLTRSLDLPRAPSAEPYRDDDGHALESEIETLYANGITTGCTPTAYCPDRSVTRGEMAAFITRAFRLPPSEADPFTDDDGHFFERAIAALHTAGITSGCSETKYCPDETVKRGEMAAFLIRSLA